MLCSPRGRPHDRPGLPGTGQPGRPSGYRMAALVLVVVAPLALAGWLAGALAIRSGWVSRGRLAAAAAVTGAPALLLIGPKVAGRCCVGRDSARVETLPA